MAAIDPDARAVIDDSWPHLEDSWRETITSECTSGEEHWAAEHALQGSLLSGHIPSNGALEAAKRIADDIGGPYQARIYHWLDKLDI
ncbi:hypothetical protein [Corynebacterium sp.]|uniref:hypothetical protein n=1 Tax=Corynebacterium sp. TaxID=1720 RepID=UPI0026DF3360|nr:hypothetical protein [Corynebacterium sp.]MDO5511398.1 hypothetical protein [Corynebacterium sp.]